jgi:hypothetical protein
VRRFCLRIPSCESRRLLLGFLLNPINRLPFQACRLRDFGDTSALIQKLLDESESVPSEGRFAASEFCPVIVRFGVGDTCLLRLFCRLGLRLG